MIKWLEKDSNLRRRCQQIYSLPPLATRESNHIYFKHLNHNIIMTRCEAVDRTWTGNLLITNQLLCQLSHNGIVIKLKSGTNRTRTYDPLLVRQMLSQLSYDPKYSKNKATRMGIEPTTSAVTGRRSNQLSHWAFSKGYIPSKPHTDHKSYIFFFYPEPHTLVLG